MRPGVAAEFGVAVPNDSVLIPSLVSSGHRISVICELPKLERGVRFPLPAPIFATGEDCPPKPQCQPQNAFLALAAKVDFAPTPQRKPAYLMKHLRLMIAAACVSVLAASYSWAEEQAKPADQPAEKPACKCCCCQAKAQGQTCAQHKDGACCEKPKACDQAEKPCQEKPAEPAKP